MGAGFLAEGNGRGFFLTAFYRHVSVRLTRKPPTCVTGFATGRGNPKGTLPEGESEKKTGGQEMSNKKDWHETAFVESDEKTRKMLENAGLKVEPVSNVPIDSIITDDLNANSREMQGRNAKTIANDTVAQYAADMKGGDSFPPIILWTYEAERYSGQCYVAMGHHRLAAFSAIGGKIVRHAYRVVCGEGDLQMLKALSHLDNVHHGKAQSMTSFNACWAADFLDRLEARSETPGPVTWRDKQIANFCRRINSGINKNQLVLNVQAEWSRRYLFGRDAAAKKVPVKLAAMIWRKKECSGVLELCSEIQKKVKAGAANYQEIQDALKDVTDVGLTVSNSREAVQKLFANSDTTGKRATDAEKTTRSLKAMCTNVKSMIKNKLTEVKVLQIIRDQLYDSLEECISAIDVALERGYGCDEDGKGAA